MPKKKKTKTKSKRKTTTSATTRRTKGSLRDKQSRRSTKTVKKKQSSKKNSSKSASAGKRKSPRSGGQRLESSWAREDAIRDRQSGDLEGLSRAEQADSESVDELVGEGNVFEAGAVAGVEEADDEDMKEVHTHEVPEDDVPDEYLDKD
jgi:hypothetical protein